MSTHIAVPDSPPVPILPNEPSAQPGEAEKQRAERRKTYGPLLEFLKNTCKRVEDEDNSQRLDILGQQNRCQAFYDDRQYGKINDKTGDWDTFNYDPAEIKPWDNKYKEQIDKLQMEMARTAIDLNVEAVDKTDSAMMEAAEFLKSRIETNRKRLFIQRPEFMLSENMALLLKTITYRYTYFDKDAEDSPRESKPKFEKKVLGENKSLTICAVCGQTQPEPIVPSLTATPQPAPRCNYCGSSTTRTMSTSPVEMDLPEGVDEVPSGMVKCEHGDPTMIQVSLNARMMSIPSSPYLVWTQMVEHGKLEKMFPDKVIPTEDGDTNQQAETRRENESSVSNSPFNSSSSDVKGGEQFKARKFKLIWLDKWVYEDYSDPRPQKLPDGRVLPPNTPLGPSFPKGMCIAKVGDTLLALWNEDKNKKWSVCVYGLREHAFHGAGTNALIPIQTTINDLLAYRLSNVYYNTNPREFIRKDAISGETLPPLNKVCVVTNLDEGQKIVGNVYDRAPGTPLPSEVPNLSEEQAGSLQEQAGTSSMSSVGTAAQREGFGTATGIAFMRDMAVGRMGPNLMLKAAMEVESSFQIAEAEQGNYSRQQLMAFAGLKPGSSGNLGYTARGVDAFINSNIRSAFVITPTPGSWMPETDQQKKADALAFADVASKVENPEILANVARALKQPMSVGTTNATQREASRRMEELAKIVDLLMSRGYTEPTDEMGQAVLDSADTASVSMVMDDHTSHIDFLRDWWVSDEARNAPPLLKKAVELRTIEHQDAMTTQMQDANARTIESQIPNQAASVVEGEIAAQQQMQQQEGMMAAQQEQQAGEIANQQAMAESELQQQAAKNELSAQDREHKLTTSVADREHSAAIKQRTSPSQPTS